MSKDTIIRDVCRRCEDKLECDEDRELCEHVQAVLLRCEPTEREGRQGPTLWEYFT